MGLAYSGSGLEATQWFERIWFWRGFVKPRVGSIRLPVSGALSYVSRRPRVRRFAAQDTQG